MLHISNAPLHISLSAHPDLQDLRNQMIPDQLREQPKSSPPLRETRLHILHPPHSFSYPTFLLLLLREQQKVGGATDVRMRLLGHVWLQNLFACQVAAFASDAEERRIP